MIARWSVFDRKRDAVRDETERLRRTRVGGTGEELRLLGQRLDRDYSLMDLLRRPGVGYDDVTALDRAEAGNLDVSRETLRQGLGLEVADAVIDQVQIAIKYAGYVERQNDAVARAAGDDAIVLPDGLDYSEVRALSTEVRQVLGRQRPATLGQAGRLPGVTPAAISLLKVFLKKSRRGETRRCVGALGLARRVTGVSSRRSAGVHLADRDHDRGSAAPGAGAGSAADRCSWPLPDVAPALECHLQPDVDP